MNSDTKYSSYLAPLSKTGLCKCHQGCNALLGKRKRNELNFINLEIEYFAELTSRNYFWGFFLVFISVLPNFYLPKYQKKTANLHFHKANILHIQEYRIRRVKKMKCI